MRAGTQTFRQFPGLDRTSSAPPVLRELVSISSVRFRLSICKHPILYIINPALSVFRVGRLVCPLLPGAGTVWRNCGCLFLVKKTRPKRGLYHFISNLCKPHCLTGISPAKNSGRFRQGKPAATELRRPT